MVGFPYRIAQSTTMSFFEDSASATFSAWRRVMVKSGDSSSSSFQIERYLAPLANGRFTSTTPFKMNHHKTRLTSITRRSDKNSLR